MSDTLRVGVVGCGIGQAHVRAYESLPDQFEVVAICDLDEGRGREVATAHDIPRVFTDLAELCRVDDLDVIDILHAILSACLTGSAGVGCGQTRRV
jgi:predicted dehydrogenase